MVIRRKSKQKRNRSPKRRTSRSKVASKRTSRRKKTSRRKSKKKTSRKRKSLRKKKSLRRKSIKGGTGGFFGCLGDRCSKNKKEWEEGAIQPAGYDPYAIRVRAVQGAASWRTPDGDVPWGDWEELEPVHRRSWIAARNSRASQRQD